jgi:lipopolysaccharide export system protein LptA
MRKVLPFFYLAVLLFKAGVCIAQVPSDTLRTIEIIKADVIRGKKVDSVTEIQTLVGNVIVHEGLTRFNCDSAVLNKRTNMLEAFGNVRINQADSVFTSSQYLKYLGNERVAYLKRNVKLTDKKSTLTTPELEYNLVTGIAKYNNGGKLVNGKTVLTSTEGIYYEDTKDVYFINKVNVVDPKTNIKADSLLYNTQTQKLNFIGPTHIKNKDGDIFTTQGTYDLTNGNAFFGNRTLVKDSSGRIYEANQLAFEDKSGTVQMNGNAIIKDSANRFILTGNEIFIGRKNNSLLATKKPVMVYWEKNDTTYITGDTLFSGFTKRVYEPTEKDSIVKDSTGNSVIKKDTADLVPHGKTILFNTDSTKNKGDTIRYFLAYHHVRVFNDSLQAVCDSLFYSGADSAFRLFYDPVVWSGKNQVAGDTIVLYTKDKKADRVYVSDNGIMINQVKGQFFNQVAGKTINGYFKDGVIDYARVKGSPAESIYFVQDKDSAFTGMNRADGSVIDMFFIKKQPDKVKFLNDVHGKLYPIRQIPRDQKFLKKFAWLDKRRPKNKLELFE